jgi:hypothetical protein
MRPSGTAFVIDNDWTWGDFAQWLIQSEWTRDHDVESTERFWAEHQFTSVPIHSEWRFTSESDKERVIRIEFPNKLGEEIVRTHQGTVIRYGYVLRYRRY